MKLCCIMKIVVTKRTTTLHKQLTQDEYDILVIIGGGTRGARGATAPLKCFKRGLSPPNTNTMQH